MEIRSYNFNPQVGQAKTLTYLIQTNMFTPYTR
jgi:hypothetical protein